MNYENLSKEAFSILAELGQNKAKKNLRSALGGAKFVLQIIYHNKEEEITPGFLSEHLNITTARVATILNLLEEKRLIIREISKEDRRKVIVKLSDLGISEAKKTIANNLEEIKLILEYLGNDAIKLVDIMHQILEYIKRKEETS